MNYKDELKFKKNTLIKYFTISMIHNIISWEYK